jgi:hypothetical protein
MPFVLHHLFTSFRSDGIYSLLILPIMSVKQLILMTLVSSLAAQIAADTIDCSGENGLTCCMGNEDEACSVNNVAGHCRALTGVRLKLEKP